MLLVCEGLVQTWQRPELAHGENSHETLPLHDESLQQLFTSAVWLWVRS